MDCVFSLSLPAIGTLCKGGAFSFMLLSCVLVYILLVILKPYAGIKKATPDWASQVFAWAIGVWVYIIPMLLGGLSLNVWQAISGIFIAGLAANSLTKLKIAANIMRIFKKKI